MYSLLFTYLPMGEYEPPCLRKLMKPNSETESNSESPAKKKKKKIDTWKSNQIKQKY